VHSARQEDAQHSWCDVMRKLCKPSIPLLLLCISLAFCVWFGVSNYKLNILLEEVKESARKQATTASLHLLQLDTQLSQLQTSTEGVIKKSYSVYPILEDTFKKQHQNLKYAQEKQQEKLTEKTQELAQLKTKYDKLEEELNGLNLVISADHRDQVSQVSQRFRKQSVDLSVIVAYDWESRVTKDTRSLSLLYVVDYFNNEAEQVCNNTTRHDTTHDTRTHGHDTRHAPHTTHATRHPRRTRHSSSSL
jgi:hypothetical protein